ncbi:MAG TPA: AarF/UbiB family protein [Actinomycetes bacterium]|nr:AarF/UbiB family protein [Actinomycetes bacterium]
MTRVQAIMTPWSSAGDFMLMWLEMLPVTVLAAWLTGRLLGVRRRSLLMALVAGSAGSLVGCTLAAPGAVGTMLLLAIVFTMAAMVGLQLVARPQLTTTIQALPAGVPHPLRWLGQRLQRLGRYSQITHLAVHHGLSPYLCIRRRRQSSCAAVAPERRARQALEQAGGMFVKLGQMLSTRPDVVPPALAHELQALQEHVAPADPAAVRALLEQELGAQMDTVFAAFDWAPVAAASIAQAHTARLRSGERVIVKVQRPGIDQLVERDLAILLHLARRIQTRTTWGAAYGVGDLAAEFADNLRQELDFQAEARSIAEVAAGLADTPEIHAPTVYAQLSTSRVLVMEQLEGTSVGQAERLDGLGADRQKLADVLLRSVLRQMLNGERFHADPHPGNVMVLADGRLGLLDFGSTGRLDAVERASVTDLLTALKQRDPALLREAVLEVATLRRRLDERQLERALARFMARHLGGEVKPSAAMLTELLQIFLAFGIAVSPTTSLLFRTLATLEGTLTTLYPGYPIVQAAEDFAAELLQERLAPATWEETAKQELVTVLPILRRAPRHLERVASLIERGEVGARISLFSDDRDVAVVTRLVNRVVLGLLGGMVALASVGLLAIPGGPQLTKATSLLDLFGYMGLFLAVVLILRVVMAVLREGAG